MLKKKVNLLLVSITVVVLFLGLRQLKNLIKKELNKTPAIIQVGTSRAHCSAFVISNKYAITARHCVPINPILLMLGANPFDKKLNIFKEGQVIGTADVIWNRNNVDVVALKGDFNNFKQLKIESTKIYLSPLDKFISCGYPYGTPKLVCSELKMLSNFVQNYAAQGYITFGFSGGPVINTTKNVAVGVNSAITEGYVIFVPLVALKEMLELEDEL